MNHANQPFVDAVKLYPDFKRLFKQFCDEAAKRLNREYPPPFLRELLRWRQWG
jgi:hypothetical protein